MAAWFEMHGYARAMKKLTLELLRHNLWRRKDDTTHSGQLIIVCAYTVCARWVEAELERLGFFDSEYLARSGFRVTILIAHEAARIGLDSGMWQVGLSQMRFAA